MSTGSSRSVGCSPRRPTGRVRSSVLRCPTDRPDPGWYPITRASTKPRAVHSPIERHLRRDIREVAELFGPAGHLLLHPDGEVLDADTSWDDTGVEPLGFENLDGSWRFVRMAAQALGAPPLIRSEEPLVRCSQSIDAACQPMFAGPVSEVATESGRRRHHGHRVVQLPSLRGLATFRLLHADATRPQHGRRHGEDPRSRQGSARVVSARRPTFGRRPLSRGVALVGGDSSGCRRRSPTSWCR
jgi:hypothetical protein